MLEFKEGRYFDSLSFVDWPNGSLMAAVYRDSDSGPWIMSYRFRYYRDGKIFESNDEKSWWRVTFKHSDLPTEPRTALRMISVMTAAQYGGEIDTVDLRTSDPSACLDAIQKRPWCHIRKSEVH